MCSKNDQRAEDRPRGQDPHLLFYGGKEVISDRVICMDERFAQEVEDGQLDKCITHEDNNTEQVTTRWHRKDQTALAQPSLTIRAKTMPNATIQKPLIEEKAGCKLKVTDVAWMTIPLALCSLLANKDHVFSRVTRECNAKGRRLDGQIRSQTLCAALGPTIVKDLSKPIVEGRPVFHLLREKNYHDDLTLSFTGMVFWKE
jgi:hypothetical protein